MHIKVVVPFAAAVLLGTVGFAMPLTAQDTAMKQSKNAPPTESLPPQVQQHVDAAYLLLNGDVSDLRLPQVLSSVLTYPQTAGNFPQANNSPEGRMKRTTAPPTKAFDQLYYFGMNLVGSWALVTRDGIIQFDALDNADEAKNIIEAGYRKMGLDPARMKYLVITHGHGDHYGGAKYLVDKYHPRVLMSAADWDMMAKQPPSRNPDWGTVPTRDMDVTDGEKLTLGGTTVTLYITPGHTPGTVSALIPVTDHGQKHLLSFLGGAGFPQNLDPSPVNGGLRAYHDSIVRFTRIGEEAGVDGIIANHPVSDYTFIDGVHDKATQMKNRKPGDPNPWITGKSTYIRYMGATLEALEAAEAMAEIRADAKAKTAKNTD